MDWATNVLGNWPGGKHPLRRFISTKGTCLCSLYPRGHQQLFLLLPLLFIRFHRRWVGSVALVSLLKQAQAVSEPEPLLSAVQKSFGLEEEDQGVPAQSCGQAMASSHAACPFRRHFGVSRSPSCPRRRAAVAMTEAGFSLSHRSVLPRCIQAVLHAPAAWREPPQHLH